MKWHIVDTERDELLRKLAKPMTKARNSTATRATASASLPVSPDSDVGTSARDVALPDATQESLPSNKPKARGSRANTLENLTNAMVPNTPQFSPRSVTPPAITSFRPAPREAYTPDRGSRQPIGKDEAAGNFIRARQYMSSPIALRTGGSPRAAVADDSMSANLSPPPQRLAASYADDPGATATTPARPLQPRLAPPSVSQLPSSFLPNSSPAPFWRYLTWETTPRNRLEFSPLRLRLHSSSPEPQDLILGERARELGSPVKNGSFNGCDLVENDLSAGDEAEDEDAAEDLQDVDLTR